MMHKVLIALGSNTQQEVNVKAATEKLLDLFAPDGRTTPAIWTEPIGLSHSDRFLNSLVTGSTTLELDSLNALLKQMERDSGRRPGACTLDLDVLSYDGVHYHESDWQRDYIQELLNYL